jgi:hypothetical protein
MAALKRNGEDAEWKRRNQAAATSIDENGELKKIIITPKDESNHEDDDTKNSHNNNKLSIVQKQKQLALNLQLQTNATPKSIHQMQQSRLNEIKQKQQSLQQNREVLSSLSDNSYNDDSGGESLDGLVETATKHLTSMNSNNREKRMPIAKRVIFYNNNNNKGEGSIKLQTNRNKLIKTDNVIDDDNVVGQGDVEIFSTDSEMDSFFKDNEPNKVVGLVEDDYEDAEFDRIVSEAQRFVFLSFYFNY